MGVCVFDRRRCQVMGITNVTTDSFSDGGQYLTTQAAVTHSVDMVRGGADLIDVGGESTRPGASPVHPDLEAARVIPVITALASQGVTVSVDTMHATTAAAAVRAGAALVNDVSAGLADPAMLDTVAATGASVCLMHWKTDRFGDASGSAHTATGQALIDEVTDYLLARAAAAIAAGVDKHHISLDPGLGFAKTPTDNLTLLAGLPQLVATGYPIVVGASRKRFIVGLRQARGGDLPIDPEPGTVAVTTLAAAAGAWAVRVHDVTGNRDAVDLVTGVTAAGTGVQCG